MVLLLRKKGEYVVERAEEKVGILVIRFVVYFSQSIGNPLAQT